MEYQRTVQDLQQWSNGMIGRMYYQKNEKNENQYRTVRLSFQPFANKIVPQWSNFVEGVPPEGMKPLPPNLLGSLSRFQAHTPEFY